MTNLFRGLEYTENSCYQDSVLLCTFAIPNDTIDNYILADTHCTKNINVHKIQNELIRITEWMRGYALLHSQGECYDDYPSKNCSELRRLVKNCRGSQDFHDTDMQDAGEFLQYIFNLFQVNIAETSETTYVTNEKGSTPTLTLVGTTYDRSASPIISVSVDKIKKETQINEFLIQVETAELSDDNLYRYNGTTYNRMLQIRKVIKSPYIVFYIHRLKMLSTGKSRKVRTRIIPVQKIGNLFLSAIITHSADHYTAYIRHKKYWYYYDDTKDRIVRVGLYDDMINSKPDPTKDGTLYYYV